jgi:hypothetical protein
MDPQGSLSKDREAIKKLSDYLQKELVGLGFDVEIQQSGSRAGPSTYVRISDPTTWRFFGMPIRISTHSKGPFEAGNVFDIGTQVEADAVIKEALKLRGMGPSESMSRMVAIEQFVREKVEQGMKPKQAYKLAQEQFPKMKENPMKSQASPAQIAARERFAEMARSGAFKRKAAKARKAKANPAKTVSDKISLLMNEGFPQKQAVAIALNQERAGKVKANPRPPMREVPMVGSELNAFDQAFRLLDGLDFEKWRKSSAFRSRRVSEAKAVKANAMLDRVLDGLERIAKLING